MSKLYVMPCLPWESYKIDAYVLDPRYYQLFGNVHTGLDINGKYDRNPNDGYSGADRDYGAPIYNITDGKVVHARHHKVWGNIVLVYHPGPDVYSQYAHLAKVMVSEGMQLSAGVQLGTMGKGAGGVYPAHLHFELRKGFGGDPKKSVSADYWPSTGHNRAEAEALVKQYYILDPLAALKKWGALWVTP